MDRTANGLTDFNKDFPAITVAPCPAEAKQRLRLFIDRCSIEAFEGDGRFAMTNLVFPQHPYTTISIAVDKGRCKVNDLTVNLLKLTTKFRYLMNNNSNSLAKLLPMMLCFFAMGFVDLVGIASNYVKADLNLTDSQANIFPSLVFFWFLIFSVPTGMLMNRIGRKENGASQFGRDFLHPLLLPVLETDMR